MGQRRKDKVPKTQPAGAGRPPRPPKKTARGLDDQCPEPVPVRIPDPITIESLARALARRPFQIVADLMLLEGEMTTNPQKLLGFQTAAKIVRYYGYQPEKIG